MRESTIERCKEAQRLMSEEGLKTTEALLKQGLGQGTWQKFIFGKKTTPKTKRAYNKRKTFDVSLAPKTTGRVGFVVGTVDDVLAVIKNFIN